VHAQREAADHRQPQDAPVPREPRRLGALRQAPQAEQQRRDQRIQAAPGAHVIAGGEHGAGDPGQLLAGLR
ncbi:hypothetical protein AAULH_14401, partial [Lactobacillus helveticus MTCC 5463]